MGNKYSDTAINNNNDDISPGSTIGPHKKIHIQRPFMDFLVESLRLSQKN